MCLMDLQGFVMRINVLSLDTLSIEYVGIIIKAILKFN